MFYAKMHFVKSKIILAACDNDLVGHIFKEGDKILDLKTYSGFYKGNEITSTAELKTLMKTPDIYSYNLVGKRTIQVAIELKIVDENNVKIIGGVPHAQAYYI